MKCSKCQIKMPPSAPNWKKLTEGNFLSYTISNGLDNQSDPYWVLCPDCYEELFSGLHKYANRTIVDIVEIDNYFAKSNADYNMAPTLTISANSDLSGYDVFIGEDKIGWEKTVAMRPIAAEKEK